MASKRSSNGAVHGGRPASGARKVAPAILNPQAIEPADIAAFAAPAETPAFPSLATATLPVAAPVHFDIEQANAPAIPPAEPELQPAPAPTQKEDTMDMIDTAARSATETVDTAATTTETVAEQGGAQAQAVFADVAGRAQTAATTAMQKGTKMVEEMNELAKGNVEALVESSRIAAKGFESMGQEVADFSRRSFESATAAFKGMAQVKSPTELFKLHSDFVRSSFDAVVAESSKNTEAMLKLAGDVAQPVSNRMAVAAEKAKLAVAA